MAGTIDIGKSGFDPFNSGIFNFVSKGLIARGKTRKPSPFSNQSTGFNLSKFNASMNAVLNKLELSATVATLTMHGVVQDMMERIIERTPVQDPPDDTTYASLSWEFDVKPVATGVEWSIQNTAKSRKGFPYPIALEYGWSDQAPNGMIRVTIEEYRREFTMSMKQAAIDAWRTRNMAPGTFGYGKRVAGIAKVRMIGGRKGKRR